MSGAIDNLLAGVEKEAEARLQVLQRLWSAADAGKVFGPPVSSDGYTVITAAEVAGGGGFGSGMGFGAPGWRRKVGDQGVTEPDAAGDAGVEGSDVQGAGGGGGGGGGAMGRPVAAIVLGPEGVVVKPVVDVTKVTLTALAVFAATAALSLKLLKK